MSIPTDTPPGASIRWVGRVHVEPGGEVSTGDIGTFIDFDGPERSDVVVTFSEGITFVAPVDEVEIA